MAPARWPSRELRDTRSSQWAGETIILKEINGAHYYTNATSNTKTAEQALPRDTQHRSNFFKLVDGEGGRRSPWVQLSEQGGDGQLIKIITLKHTLKRIAMGQPERTFCFHLISSCRIFFCEKKKSPSPLSLRMLSSFILLLGIVCHKGEGGALQMLHMK